jgi:excisionase family DNA binding protein
MADTGRYRAVSRGARHRQAWPPMTPDERVQAALAAANAANAELFAALAELAAANRPRESSPVELLPPKVAAARLGMSRSSLYNALGRGDIRSAKVGGRRLIASTEIDRVAAGERRG